MRIEMLGLCAGKTTELHVIAKERMKVELTPEEFEFIQALMTAPMIRAILKKVAETGYLLKCKENHQRE